MACGNKRSNRVDCGSQTSSLENGIVDALVLFPGSAPTREVFGFEPEACGVGKELWELVLAVITS